MSDSVRPHRRQPTRLPRPWDSPGKNTGAGCHVLLQCMKGKSESEVAQSCLTLSDLMDCSPPGSSVLVDGNGIFQARVLELIPDILFLLRFKMVLWCPDCFLKFFFNICLLQVLVVACRLFSCSTWDLAPWSGIAPRSPALGAQSFSLWATRNDPDSLIFMSHEQKEI